MIIEDKIKEYIHDYTIEPNIYMSEKEFNYICVLWWIDHYILKESRNRTTRYFLEKIEKDLTNLKLESNSDWAIEACAIALVELSNVESFLILEEKRQNEKA